MSEPARTIRLDAPATVQSPPCDFWPGEVLDERYRLDALLGWGGQAVVFQATDLQAGTSDNPEPLAVKIVRNDLPADERQAAMTMLRWEARLLRRLRHPALPRAVQFHNDNNLTWLVRELVPGSTLAEVANRGPCGVRQVQRWAVQLCDLLSYLHTRRPPIICGDLKPSNLILRPDGTLALIDLGAALTRTQRPPRRPRPRHGTPGYASPEQLGSGTSDERSDLFSLAATCYELLTGEDPTAAPLQFDLPRLNMAAPGLAPALRWALALDVARRAPTAAALRAALTLPQAPEPLHLASDLRITNQRELVRATVQYAQLLEEALVNGTFERWLSVHPDRIMGKLLHDWRAMQQQTPSRQRPLEVLLMTMAPADGSPALEITPRQISFGEVPLRQWRLWSAPQTVTIHNATLHPLCWDIECPPSRKLEVRLLVEERPVRQHSGVLPPGGRCELALVAAGRTGEHQGSLTLRCGKYTFSIPWEATARPLLPLGTRWVSHLEELNPTQPDLVPLLKELLEEGMLRRWLHAQGERALAAELATIKHNPDPDELTLQLLVGQVLHRLDPHRFPRLQIHGLNPLEEPQIAAGSQSYYILEVENLSEHPCNLSWSSRHSWVRLKDARTTLPPGGRVQCRVLLAPPAAAAPGSRPIELDLLAGNLLLPISFPVQILTENVWMRMLRWFVG
jgi:serine/threonine protein kinase